MNERLDVIDAETLMSTPLPRTKFFVEGLIPQGLTILAGASKAGKSWMVLWMALQIAKGEKVWGLETAKSDVLYMSLEDTMARLQDRIYQLTDEAPPELRLVTESDRIGTGLEDQIRKYLSDYPGTRLIILDTLQKVRNSKQSSNVNAYATDYNDISSLKKLADEYGIGIILVHHLRKLKDGEDNFNEISGSTGLMGAADSTLIFRRERGADVAKLKATGRDIEDQELILKLDSKKFIWHLQKRKGPEAIKREKVPDFIFRVTDFARQKFHWEGSATELLLTMGESDLTSNYATRLLARFSEDHLASCGIKYQTGRKYGSRYVKLDYTPPAQEMCEDLSFDI